jgi:hypothetical protein
LKARKKSKRMKARMTVHAAFHRRKKEAACRSYPVKAYRIT